MAGCQTSDLQDEIKCRFKTFFPLFLKTGQWVCVQLQGRLKWRLNVIPMDDGITFKLLSRFHLPSEVNPLPFMSVFALCSSSL